MKLSSDYIAKANEFLNVAPQFHLGNLPTEQPHPLTTQLSFLAKKNPAEALSILHQIDSAALDVVLQNCWKIEHLSEMIRQTLSCGNNIFICGCGATGRLSLTCETLWRRLPKFNTMRDRVISFMAGGDAALIKSIENFEDHPEFGARQLEELGYKNGDLLIGATEGGETPFVIGAVERASELSSNRPFFLYCNPDSVLCACAERFSKVYSNPQIEKINLYTGPMALAGSTRMQASTVLEAAIGYALFYNDNQLEIRRGMGTLIDFWKSLDISFLTKFIKAEGNCYKQGNYILYRTAAATGITILTDTTERSPTFSMVPFENALDSSTAQSLCYLYIPDAADSADAWRMLLGREPRTLEWKEISGIASRERLLGFDFSAKALKRRISAAPKVSHYEFSIKQNTGELLFDFLDEHHFLKVESLSELETHLVLKMLLNSHSTLVMGILDRYEGNLMTWVRSSNNKLIDRTIRYVNILLKRKNISLSYEEIARGCFKMMETTPADQPLVLAAVDYLTAKSVEGRVSGK